MDSFSSPSIKLPETSLNEHANPDTPRSHLVKGKRAQGAAVQCVLEDLQRLHASAAAQATSAQDFGSTWDGGRRKPHTGRLLSPPFWTILSQLVPSAGKISNTKDWFK